MNRPIKFQAYWKDVGIFDVLKIDFGSSVIIAIPVTGTGSEEGETWIETNELDWEDVELRQFTGLHDKHGREVYEGDIIRTPSDDYGLIQPVVFRHGGFRCDVDDEVVDKRWFHLQGIEVIGNIYENPLLEYPELVRVLKGGL